MHKVLPSITALAALLCAPAVLTCGDDNGTEPPQSGKIAATVAHIADSQDDHLMIAVYDASVDWVPGTSNDLIISSTRAVIDSDDFSLSCVMQEIDAQGNETGVEKIFPPATYSVLFFVAPPGQPPAKFAEVRVSVDGDATAIAPAWGTWFGEGAAR